MAKKTLNFAVFTPGLWDEAQGLVASTFTSGQTSVEAPMSTVVLDLSEDAPAETKRKQLRTRITSLSTPHDAFKAFHASHDMVNHVNAYAETDTSQSDDPDTLQDRPFVVPRQFQLYELGNTPNQFYFAAPETLMRSVFKRYKDRQGQSLHKHQHRIVDIRDLETKLTDDFSINGYKLRNIQSTPTISAVDVAGLNLSENTEVQDVKNRAELMRAIGFIMQSENKEAIRVQVAQNGAVTFLDYPGEASALGILHQLEPIIRSSADLD